MKQITLQILQEEDEALIISVLEAFQKNGKIAFKTIANNAPHEEAFDKNDEEISDLLDQADRERGVPYEELRKRFGL
jgi:hypothetical protein